VSKQAKRDRQRLNREARRQYEESLARRRRTFRTARFLAILAVPVVGVGAYLALSGDDEKKSPAAAAGCRVVEQPKARPDGTLTAAEPTITDFSKTYLAEVQTSCGSFTIQLATSEAPETTNSFAFLVDDGFYDGLTFHRVGKDFVIQGGDPKGDGTGGPGYVLPDEPPADGYLTGTVAMANSGPGTSGSQFFVLTTEEGAAALNQQLTEDGKFSYSILGQVVEGFETVERINKLGSSNPEPSLQTPKAPIVITKITISEAPSTTTTT
jgi:cyclophilin family peptidyl-prolyl cis-trans isomerase